MVLDSIHPGIAVNAPALWADRFPVPQPGGHKYRRGHAVVASGDVSHTGAARLAARGALRAGAGLVTIASPRDALTVNAASNLAVMVRPVDGADELTAWLSDPRLNSIVLGPGGGVGRSMREMVLAALAGERAVVLDADALTSFAEVPETLFAAIKARGAWPTVLTPHEGEFVRLFDKATQEAETTSKCDKANAAAVASGAIVLLKGSDTVVASPEGRVSITENAPPWLATAGSGDVLAGFAAGLLAQGMPGFEAASAATWLHGEAGSEAGPGLIAEDLPEALRVVYRRLFVDLGAWP
jgi:hydroxyethylthiazole kinase-like uncharacterized protein yjeF